MSGKALRRIWMGLSTVLGFADRGFFIPYRYADQLGTSDPGCFSGVATLFQESENNFRSLLTTMDDHADDLMRIGDQSPPEPRWAQDWFPGLDGAAAYCMTRSQRPSRVIEIGSGHSTRFVARAVRDEGLDTSIIAIDPAPRADLRGIGVNFYQQTVQTVSVETFGVLKAGDILSIDSSHILMPGSDVDIVFNRIVPMLPRGVLIHIHDMFLPDGYPESWRWRGYNEQLAVSTMLSNPNTEVLWASQYVRTRMEKEITESIAVKIPVPPGAYESSLWFRKG